MVGSLLLGLAGFTQAQPSRREHPGNDARLLACEKAEACQSHLAQAAHFYEQGRYGMAIEEYQAAYTLQPYPPFLYNIARLHHKQDRLPDAIAYYQRYLDSTYPERVERARQYLSEAQDLLEKRSEPAPAPLILVPPAGVALPVVPTPPAIVPTPGTTLRPGRNPGIPVYKKWWFWTLLGATVSGVATAVGIGVYARVPDVAGLPGQTVSLRH